MFIVEGHFYSCAVRAEGRIEPSDGTLMCSYHGWRFRGDGACARIPQALDARAEDAACSSGRSCAAVHPTQVRRGLLHKQEHVYMHSILYLSTCDGAQCARHQRDVLWAHTLPFLAVYLDKGPPLGDLCTLLFCILQSLSTHMFFPYCNIRHSSRDALPLSRKPSAILLGTL